MFSLNTKDTALHLGDFEELVLLAIIHLDGNAYGMTIRQAVESTGRRATIGAVYTTLERLEEKGFIKSTEGEATPERGNRVKRYFSIEGLGTRALNGAEEARRSLRTSRIPQIGQRANA